jgi:hypothetical protein
MIKRAKSEREKKEKKRTLYGVQLREYPHSTHTQKN